MEAFWRAVCSPEHRRVALAVWGRQTEVAGVAVMAA